MIYSRIMPTNQTNLTKLYIDRPKIIVTIPDSNVDICDAVYSKHFTYSNCKGLLVKATNARIGTKMFYGKQHYYDVKKKMIEIARKDKMRKIPVVQLTSAIAKKSQNATAQPYYYFYDGSSITFAANVFMTLYNSPKVALEKLLLYLQKMYQDIHKLFGQNISIDVMFVLSDPESTLSKLVEQIKYIYTTQKFEQAKFYDNFIFGRVLTNDNDVLMVLGYIDEKTKFNKIVPNAFTKLFKALEVEKEKDVSIKEAKQGEETVNVDLSKGEVEDKKTVSKVGETVQKDVKVKIKPELEEEIKQIDEATLKSALSKYGIKDPNVIANVKTILNKLLNETKFKLTKNNIGTVILKALNYSLYGTFELHPHVKKNPKLLLERINKINPVYRKPLEFPQVDYSIHPKASVDIDTTNGQFRHEYEMNKNIHNYVKNLASSMETTGTLKIKGVNVKEEDDNQNRYYLYTFDIDDKATKQKYQVSFKIPSVVNDRYFKIKGNTYILSSQHFLKPLTKTRPNEVRFLSNYATITLSLENIRFDLTQVEKYLDYLQIRIPKLFEEYNRDKGYVKFYDGTYLYYKSIDKVYQDEKGVWTVNEFEKVISPDGKELPEKRYEFIFNVVEDKVKGLNAEFPLVKKLPYVQLYIAGHKIPLIIYLWYELGLEGALDKLGIKYKYSKEADSDAYVSFEVGNQYFNIYANTPRERYLLNGLFALKNLPSKFENLKPEAIYDILTQKYGSRFHLKMGLMRRLAVDNVTKQVLEAEGQPTEFTDILAKSAINKLLNDPVQDLSDLTIYRARLSEILANLIHTQISQAITEYEAKLNSGDEKAKLFLDENYVINNLLNTGLLQVITSSNPVEELMISSRALKTGRGVGGVPTNRAIKNEHRNFHETQYGNIAVNATPENTNVGVLVHHTLNPLIINDLGEYGIRALDNIKNFEMLAVNEALVPFPHQVDSDRLVLATTHIQQAIPIDNREPPLVRTGGEFIVPQLASSKFVIRAEDDGKVVDVVPNTYLIVKYENGKRRVYDISPRTSRTKRGAHLLLEMETLRPGDKFKKNETIAWTKTFKRNVYAPGKNVFVAMMNYLGYNHEDAYAITKDLAKETTRTMVEKQAIVVPVKSIVKKLVTEIGKKVQVGDTLVEFTLPYDIDDYIREYDINVDENSEEYDNIIGKVIDDVKHVVLKASKDGEIADIKVYINNKVNLDKNVIKLHDELVKQTKARISEIMSSDMSEEDKRKALDNIDTAFFEIGGHKYKGNEFKGALIEYSIKYKKSLTTDKISNRYGAKGVISYQIPVPPKGEFSPRIDVFISPIGVFSRKNLVMLKEIYLGKIVYFLLERIREMAKDKKTKAEDIAKLIIDVLSTVMPEKSTNALKEYINGLLRANKLKQTILSSDFELYVLIPPFEDVTFEQIRKAAKILGIPLDERVYIPELDQWTKNKVPVGVGYYQVLEHFGDIYAAVRGSEKYNWLTGQPTQGKSKLGGQKIGHLDVYAMLTMDVPNLLTELLTVRSDDHKAKTQAYAKMMKDGKFSLAEVKNRQGGQSGTNTLVKTYITALGLEL